jgi:hypothetical protein
MRLIPRQCHPVTGEPYPMRREILRGLKTEDKRHRNADKAVREARRVVTRAARRART